MNRKKRKTPWRPYIVYGSIMLIISILRNIDMFYFFMQSRYTVWDLSVSVGDIITWFQLLYSIWFLCSLVDSKDMFLQGDTKLEDTNDINSQ